MCGLPRGEPAPLDSLRKTTGRLGAGFGFLAPYRERRGRASHTPAEAIDGAVGKTRVGGGRISAKPQGESHAPQALIQAMIRWLAESGRNLAMRS